MVEGAALEKQYGGNLIEGSNPSLSAILRRSGLFGAMENAEVGIRTGLP